MSEESEMKSLEARLTSIEAKLAGGTTALNTEDLISFPQFDVGMPPNVPLGGGNDGMFAWDAEKKQIGAGAVMVGRRVISLAASSEGLGDHTWAIRVTFGANGDSAEFFQYDGEQPTDTTTYLPLYTVTNGEMTTDRRGNFLVQCWE